MATAKKGAKRPAATKTASKKPAAKKPAATKAAAKKPAAKKTAAKKTAVKKPAKKAAAPKAAAKPAAAKPAKKAAAKKPAAKKAPRKANPAFMKAMNISPSLAAVIGPKPMPRTEVTKKLWAYIKKGKLQDAVNKRVINADDKLKAVFGKAKFDMFEMTKLVGKHLS